MIFPCSFFISKEYHVLKAEATLDRPSVPHGQFNAFALLPGPGKHLNVIFLQIPNSLQISKKAKLEVIDSRVH